MIKSNLCLNGVLHGSAIGTFDAVIQLTLSRSTPPDRVRGLALVELLVALAIIAVLMALLLLAVQQSRETARCMHCANNLKQIGLALQMHHDTHRVLPHNGFWDGSQTISNAGGTPFAPSTTDYALGGVQFYWGVGDPLQPAVRPTGSWLYAILPFLEQQAVYDQRTWAVSVAAFICPSRRAAAPHTVAAADTYGAYDGGGWRWAKTDYAGNSLLMPGFPGKPPKLCENFAGITDGTAATLLAGEKAFDRSVQTEFSWYWDEPFFLGGSAGTARDGIAVIPGAVGNDYKTNWGASHSGGAQFALADGSVRGISYDVTWNVMSALLTPRGGD